MNKEDDGDIQTDIGETLELQCDSIKENVNLQDEYENKGGGPRKTTLKCFDPKCFNTLC